MRVIKRFNNYDEVQSAIHAGLNVYMTNKSYKGVWSGHPIDGEALVVCDFNGYTTGFRAWNLEDYFYFEEA
tara:strand:+ start:269 stop:481 length:213 start_codon:yes stop_codon:yes gene_type:complete